MGLEPHEVPVTYPASEALDPRYGQIEKVQGMREGMVSRFEGGQRYASGAEEVCRQRLILTW